MKEYFVDLTNGERLTIKVNFGTLYYLQKMPEFNKIAKKEDTGKRLTDEEAMELAADLVYAILRSNGKTVTFDEALQLVPPGIDSIKYIFTGFQEEYQKYNKKKRDKIQVKPQKK